MLIKSRKRKREIIKFKNGRKRTVKVATEVLHVMRIQGQVLLTQLGQVPQIIPVTVLLKAKK